MCKSFERLITSQTLKSSQLTVATPGSKTDVRT